MAYHHFDDSYGCHHVSYFASTSAFVYLDPATGRICYSHCIYPEIEPPKHHDFAVIQALYKAFDDDRQHRRTLGPDDFDYTRSRQIPPADAINQAPLIDDYGRNEADFPLWWWELNWHPKPKSKSIAYRKHRLACYLAMKEDRDR